MDQKLKNVAAQLKKLSEERRSIWNDTREGNNPKEYSENALRCDNEINKTKIERAEL